VVSGKWIGGNMLEVLIPTIVSALSSAAGAAGASKRAKYQGIQSAIGEEGKAQQDELAKQSERESSALGSLIEAYRSGLME